MLKLSKAIEIETPNNVFFSKKHESFIKFKNNLVLIYLNLGYIFTAGVYQNK